MPRRRFDLVVVGLGSAGLVAADFAARFGLRVAAVERDRIGGDCLWTGCVPSKALIASARAAHTVRHAERYGLAPAGSELDTSAVWTRVRAIQEEIATTTDSPDRLRAAGVEVHLGEPARLVSPTMVRVGDAELEARFVLLCTGARPAVPPLPGLTEAGFLTSETVFALDRVPESLVVLGGGPLSVELAQAFRRLGAAVTLLQRGPRILPRDDAALVARLDRRLRAEGVELRVGVEPERVTVAGGQKVVYAGDEAFAAREILLGVGRRPNVEGLGLEAVGLAAGPEGLAVDGRLRTRVKSIYAAGELVGRHRFTHSAGFEAARAVRNMFLPGSRRGELTVPWCTFTDPELAHVGLTAAQARERYGADRVREWRAPLEESDRARAESATDGELAIVTRSGRIVGANALAPAAGELIHELALAVDRRLMLTQLAGVIHVYPTIGLGVQLLAGEAALEQAQRFRRLVRRAR